MTTLNGKAANEFRILDLSICFSFWEMSVTVNNSDSKFSQHCEMLVTVQNATDSDRCL